VVYALGGQGAYSAKRKVKKITGRGAYSYDNPGPVGRAGEAAGALLGGTYGGSIGKYLMSKAGRYLGHKVGKLFGSGSYGYVEGSPVTRMAPDPPMFINNRSDDSVVITHREYLGDVITSSTIGALKIQNYVINPSNNDVFPWLSQIAGPNFQQYKFDGLVFEFKSFSADALNSANTALGSVFACINYDSADLDFTSRNEIENSDWSRSCKPSENVMIPVECAPRQTAMNGLLYIANGNNIPAGTDPKTYILGKMSFGTTGFQAANVNIGSLYVTYKVRLYKTLLSKPASFSNISQWVRNSPTNAAPLGTSSVSPSASRVVCDTLGLKFLSGTQFSLDRRRLVVGQTFILSMCWTGISSPTLNPPDPGAITVSPLGSAEGVADYVSDTAAFVKYPIAAITDSRCGFIFSFIIHNNSQDITFTIPAAGGLPGSGLLTMNLWQICGIAPVNQGIYNGTA